MNTVPRNGLTNKQWEKISNLLPPEKPWTGRTNKSHRIIISAILWVLRTGAPWRDLPERYGSWRTAYSRWYRWTKKGIWQKILETLQQEADAEGKIDWEVNHVDGSIIRAHQHSAGARKHSPDGEERTQENLALGRSQGGYSTKVHFRVDGKGKVLTIALTPGQTHESQVFEELMKGGKVKRSRRGRPKQNPKALAGDKAYSSNSIRSYLKERRIKDVIPTRSNERQRENFDKDLYRERNHVERSFNWAKHCRRLATRYEKLPEFFLSMWTLAAIFMWL